jgi:hypothetical protein
LGNPRHGRLGSLRHDNRPALNFFNVHAAILSESAKTQKPTIGFSARFFLVRSNRWKILSLNVLCGTKFPKTEKTQKKMPFSMRGPPIFLPNRPQKGPFLLSVRF